MTQRTRLLLVVLAILVIANLGQALALLQTRSSGTVVGGIVTGTNDRAAAFNVDADGNLLGALDTDGAAAIIQASTSGAITATGPGSVRIITGVTGEITYITEWGVTIGTTTATAQTVQLVRGTGTTCLTGQVALTGAYTGATMSTNVGINSPTVISEGSGLGVRHIVPAATDVCVVTTGSQSIGGSMSWSQF